MSVELDIDEEVDRTLRLVNQYEDFDRVPGGEHRENVLFIIRGELWKWEPVGCVICVEDDEILSFQSSDDDDKFHCTKCGPLTEEKYLCEKTYRVTIGPVERVGHEEVRDSMLFPVSMSIEERETLIESLLDEAEAEEREASS